MTRNPHPSDDGSGADRPDPRPAVDGRRLDPADPLLLERMGVVVPDDARRLDPVKYALEHPGRARARARLRQLLGQRDPLRHIGLDDRTGTTSTAGQAPRTSASTLRTLGGVLLLVAAVMAASLMALLQPRGPVPTQTAPGALPLARPTASAVAGVGALLPGGDVQLDGRYGFSTRDVRPAVLVVPPEGPCADCGDRVAALARQAEEYRLLVHVVAAPGGDAVAQRAVADAGRQSVHLLVDGSGRLQGTYGDRAALRAVLVHADGVVGGIVEDVALATRYEQVLAPLRLPGPRNLPDAPAGQ